MILVRNVFRLRFGKSREAVALWRQGIGALRRAGISRDIRLLTDVSGPFYTLVVEETFESLGAMDVALRADAQIPDWPAFYQQFAPLAESGYRELFTVVEGEESP